VTPRKCIVFEFKRTLPILMPICCICYSDVSKYLASGFTGLWAVKPRVRVLIPRNFENLLFSKFSDRRWTRPTLLKLVTNTVSPYAKRPELGDNHSPLSSTKLRKRRSIPLLSPYALLACAGSILLKNVSQQIIVMELRFEVCYGM
jgi:hypothetical protein